jgi:hypothetical protein
VSNSYGGCTSDKAITNDCGILDNLQLGDVVMVDRGFTIAQEVGEKHAKLEIPAFKLGKSQLHPYEVEETRKIANVRVHVERVIGMLRQKYEILTKRMPITMLTNHNRPIPVVDKIIRVCCSLINLCTGIIPE